MKNIVVYPPPLEKATNSYIRDLCDSVDSINKNEINDIAAINLIRHLFDSNIFIFNWPENIIFRKLGFIQVIIFLISFYILLLRGVKIVWVFHNIQPHQGHNSCTRFLYRLFLKRSDLIITHSISASLHLKENTTSKIFYHPHPFKQRIELENSTNVFKRDILIWGSIEKYKGIAEFLEYMHEYNLFEKYRVMIIGKCGDEDYEKKITSFLKGDSVFENRFADFDELKTLIRETKLVLFPYLKNSISSSGALMDSLLFGATVVGPNVGAFKDISADELCFTFNDYSDIFRMVDRNATIEPNKIEQYVNCNTWECFSRRFDEYIEKI